MLIPQNRYWMKEGTKKKGERERKEKNNRMQRVSWLVFLEISFLLQGGFLQFFSPLLALPPLSHFSSSFIHLSASLSSCFFLDFFGSLCPYLEEKSVCDSRRGAEERTVICPRQRLASDWERKGERVHEREREREAWRWRAGGGEGGGRRKEKKKDGIM